MDKIEKNYINKQIEEYLKDWFLDDKPDYLYLKCFNTPCNRYGLLLNEKGKPEILTYINDLDTDYSKYKYLDYNAFIKELDKKCDMSRQFYDNSNNINICYFYNRSMTFVYGNSNNVKEIMVLSDHRPIELFDFIKENVIQKKDDSEFTYITRSKNGDFNSIILKIKHNLNVSLDNYNEDLPYDKIKEFCKSSTSGLMLFSGLPGSGKHFKKLILIIF